MFLSKRRKPKKTGRPADAGRFCAGDIEYRLIRSDRRTMSLELAPGGELTVRAPRRAAEAEVREFVLSKQGWVRKHRDELRSRAEEAAAAGLLSDAEIRALKQQALAEIPPRVAYYAAQMGVSYSGISVRCQKTRWGSCSSRRHLSFNCLLMLTPPAVRDSVIVHELCHLREMNHSQRFYTLVRTYYPDYDRQNRWLKTHGSAILARVQK